MGILDALKNAWDQTGDKVRNVFQEGEFSVEFELNGETKTFSGNTSLEAIEGLFKEHYPRGVIFKTRGKLTLYFEGKKSEQLFFGVQMRRLIGNTTVRQIWAKRMEMMLK